MVPQQNDLSRQCAHYYLCTDHNTSDMHSVWMAIFTRKRILEHWKPVTIRISALALDNCQIDRSSWESIQSSQLQCVIIAWLGWLPVFLTQ